jgi:hypothetical protein
MYRAKAYRATTRFAQGEAGAPKPRKNLNANANANVNRAAIIG